MRSGDVNECDVSMVWDETRQHLEDRGPVFSNQCKMLQNRARVKNSFNVQEKPVGFNVNTKVHGYDFRVHIPLTL